MGLRCFVCAASCLFVLLVFKNSGLELSTIRAVQHLVAHESMQPLLNEATCRWAHGFEVQVPEPSGLGPIYLGPLFGTGMRFGIRQLMVSLCAEQHLS